MPIFYFLDRTRMETDADPKSGPVLQMRIHINDSNKDNYEQTRWELTKKSIEASCIVGILA